MKLHGTSAVSPQSAFIMEFAGETGIAPAPVSFLILP
jgi:hypothetical protein